MILEVKLTNVKSYSNQKIRFSPGLNAIIGENGAGKTTILEAIGFALFNTLQYKISDFLRRGEKRGEIYLKITGGDERIYEIVRKISTNGTLEYYVNDPETGRVAEGTSEVIEWVEENLSLEIEPAVFFENVIGVSQGRMASQFLEVPSVRDRIFSPILGVEGYKKAFERSREYENYINQKIIDAEKKIAILSKETEYKDKLSVKLDGLQKQKKDIEDQLKKIEVNKVKERVERFDKIQSELNTLKVEIKQKNSEIENVKKEIERHRRILKEIQAAGKEVEMLETAYKEYVHAEKEISRLEPQKSELEERLRKLNELSLEVEKISLEIEMLQKKLEEIAEKEKEMATTLPLAEKEKKLNEALNRIKSAEENLKTLEQQSRVVEKEISSRKEILKKIEENEVRLTILKQKLIEIKPMIEKRDSLMSYKASLKAKISIERENYERLKDSICPILKEDCSKIESVRELKKEELDFLKNKFIEVEEKSKKLEKMYEEGKKLDAEINKLEGEVMSRDDVVNEIKEKEVLLSEINNKISGLKSLVEQKNRIEEELGSVSGSYEKLAGLKAEISRKKSIENNLKMLKVKRDKISSETAELKKIEAELKELKDKIAEFLKIREENSKSFQRYIQLKEKFSRLEEITNRLRELDGARNEADVRLSELKSRIDYLSGVYSPEEHLKLKEELTNLVKKKGELEGKLQNIASGIEEVRSEIEILIEKENELGHAKKAMKILEEKYDFIKRLREIFKLAIPEIIRAFVDAVSLQANRIFCELMDDYGWELYWTEDFGIKAKYRGRDIEFAQMSGGEQMCAALSIRLALLKTTSNAGIVFFDEPTQNMDDVRRRNLASQLSRIEGFEQIVVISHDATFEEMVENAVKVRKNGVSIVEQ